VNQPIPSSLFFNKRRVFTAIFNEKEFICYKFIILTSRKPNKHLNKLKVLKTILVEDEETSRETLRNYINKYCENVEIIAECANIKEGKTAIEEMAPDLVFLDVEMPFGNAFDLLEQLEVVNFETVFVTAYSQYALKALNYSASYYILKPIDIDELESSIKKVRENIEMKNEGSFTLQTKVLLENFKHSQNKDKKVVLPVLDGFEVVQVNDIIRCVANDNFTDFHLLDGSKKVICRTLKFYDDVLNDSGFIRVHRSHLINAQYVKSYKKGKGGVVIMSDDSHVDVSASKKQNLLNYFS